MKKRRRKSKRYNFRRAAQKRIRNTLLGRCLVSRISKRTRRELLISSGEIRRIYGFSLIETNNS